MTSPINSYSQTQGLSDPGSSGTAAAWAKSQATGSSTTPAQSPSELVTLTPDAQTSTQLLDAARAASGVDDQAVQSLRSAILADLYSVPPETLATSIVTALKEVQA